MNRRQVVHIILFLFFLLIVTVKYGYSCGGTAPTANFSVDNAAPVVGETINFTDASSNTPTSWAWTFTGGTPASSTNQNPSVSYTIAGNYTVSLVATNNRGSDTETKTDYIAVGTAPTAGTIGIAQTICYGTTPALLTSTADGGGSGTITYEWQTNASGSWVTIPGVTSSTYQPPALTATTSYHRRTVAVYGGKTRYSAYTASVAITVQVQVTAGSIVSDQSICTSGTPNALATNVNGNGSGTISYQWQTNASGSFVDIAGQTTSGYQPPALTSTTSYQRRTVSLLNGLNCYSGYTAPIVISVAALPVSPSITKVPIDATVCFGQLLSVNATAGSGGTGTVNDEYNYSTNGGTNWSTWQTSVPSFSSVTGVNLIQSRRTATGNGCSTSMSNQVSWNVNPIPVAVISFPVDGAADCPQLISDQDFNAETGTLGYSIIRFTVNRPSGATMWAFDYQFTGVNVTTYAGSPSQLSVIQNASGLSTLTQDIEIWITNSESTIITLTLTVDKVWDSINCENDTDVSSQFIILPMPTIGIFN